MGKKKTAVIVTPIIVVIMILLGVYATGNLYLSDAKIYKDLWDVDIPGKATQLYNAKSPQDFHGDGYRYTVYQLSGEESELLQGCVSDRNEAAEETVDSILNELDVEKKNRPDFQQDYSWKHMENYGNQLTIIYIGAESKLYVIQEAT